MVTYDVKIMILQKTLTKNFLDEKSEFLYGFRNFGVDFYQAGQPQIARLPVKSYKKNIIFTIPTFPHQEKLIGILLPSQNTLTQLISSTLCVNRIF